MPSNLPTSQLAYPTHIIPLPLPCPSQTVNAERACPAKNRATAAMPPRSKHREPVSNMLRVFHSTRRPQGTGKNPPPQNNLLHSTNTARRHHQRGQGKTSSAQEAASGTPSGTNRKPINKQRPNNKRKPLNGANPPPPVWKEGAGKQTASSAVSPGKNLYLSGRIGTTSPDMALCPAFISAPGKGP